MKNWFKEYWVYVAIAIFGGIIGTALSLTIWHQNNIGTLADWVSGIGSVVAIVFAYLQIREQRDEYEDDKKHQKEIAQINNKPLFEVYISNILNSSDETFFFPAEKLGKENEESLFTFRELSNQYYLLDLKFFYCIKSVKDCTAINPTLVITYESPNHKEIDQDIIHADTIIRGGKEVRFLTKKILNLHKVKKEKTSSENDGKSSENDGKSSENEINYDTYLSILNAKKTIELYFMSSDNIYYKQTFKGRTETVFRDDGTTPDEITFVSGDTEKIKEDEIPDYTTATEMMAVDEENSYQIKSQIKRMVPVRKFNIW